MKRRPTSLYLTASAVLMGAAVSLPILYMLYLSFSPQVGSGESGLTIEHYRRFFADDYYIRNVLWLSIKYGGLSAILALLFGYPVALAIARSTNIKWRTALLVLSVLPLWVNVVVRAFGWSVLLTERGLVNSVLLSVGLISTPIRFLSTELGVLVGLVQVSIPYIVLPLVGVLESIPRALEEAAESVGAGKWRTLLSIIVPLSLPGVVAGTILVFALNVGGFAIPALLGGGKVRMMALVLYEQATMIGNFPFAAALGCILLLASALCLVPYFYYNKQSYFGESR